MHRIFAYRHLFENMFSFYTVTYSFTFFPYTAYPTIKALVNGSVGLPCNISQTKEENSIKLILWYKNNILGTPIYSIDARDVNITQARHFVAPAYHNRASFELNFAARLAVLLLEPILEDDDAEYICRVDPRWSRTTVSHVKLDVICKYTYKQMRELNALRASFHCGMCPAN